MCISTYISSATFAWSSKLMVDIDSMGPHLQLLGGHFSNFLLGKVSTEFKLHGMSIFHDIQMATYFGTGWCYSHMVGYDGSPTYTCWYDLDPIQGQGQGQGAFELPTTSEAVHAGGNDCSPLQGFLVLYNTNTGTRHFTQSLLVSSLKLFRVNVLFGIVKFNDFININEDLCIMLQH